MLYFLVIGRNANGDDWCFTLKLSASNVVNPRRRHAAFTLAAQQHGHQVSEYTARPLTEEQFVELRAEAEAEANMAG